MVIDQYGFIVQADGDGGDSAQRTGFVQAALFLQGKVMTLLTKWRRHEIAPELCVRHPHQEGFRSDPKHMSRDQTDPLVIAAGLYGDLRWVRRMLLAQVRRLGKYQNKDWTNLQTVGLYIRALRYWQLWPLLCVVDLGLLSNAFIILVKGLRNPDHSDDNNHILRLAQAQRVLPTPISWLARKLYKRIRPSCPGMTVRGEGCPVMGALVWYHSSNGGNPDVAELWRPIVARF